MFSEKKNNCRLSNFKRMGGGGGTMRGKIKRLNLMEKFCVEFIINRRCLLPKRSSLSFPLEYLTLFLIYIKKSERFMGI